MIDSVAPLATPPGLRIRREYFGALAWFDSRRSLYRLDSATTAITLLHLHPRTSYLHSRAETKLVNRFGVTFDKWITTRSRLEREHLLVPTGHGHEQRSLSSDIDRVADYFAQTTPPQPIAKPFWAHLQPFTRCNQRCVHCYCNGGPEGDLLRLSLDSWHEIIRILDDYGVMDIYVTGGESLLYEEFFDIAKDILRRGLGFGLSTNASVISPAVLKRLADLNLQRVQVSLDGASAEIHDFIRGTPGTFQKTVEGIRRISAVCEPVVNTVVNVINKDSLDSIVRLGLSLGSKSFKFFPQKHTGRARLMSNLQLNDRYVMEELIPKCQQLSQQYGVPVETLGEDRPCGSALSGFAINQTGDIFPCIFGIEMPEQRCGNILHNDLDTIWFGSPIFTRFRAERTTPCHRCER